MSTPPAIRVIWPEIDDATPPFEAPCPNCNATGPKPHLLDVAWTAPKLTGGDRKPVFACPTCEARFYPPLDVPNYHDPDVMDWGWHQFHIQQGAGLVPITDTIGRIARPPGTRFLEIGCGYGFGLDYAIHALGWTGIGIDPSPMARLGATDLGVTINDGYFPQADPQAALWDVIAATEVIEHVETPADLLAAIRTRLAPDGILLLTTPDGDAINRTTPEAALVQLLAPGIHMVFQTEASLRRLLDNAGFSSAGIGRDGLTLVAYAGPIEAALVDDDARQRRRFRAYLSDRATTVPPTTDLGLGFAGRALFEAAVDLDWSAARTIRDHLWPVITERFGLDLDTITALPADFATLSLAALKDRMPLNLGMILYAEASRLRADTTTRPQAAPLFLLASAAAAALHAALARLSLNDGLAEELSWRGIAEAAIEAARLGEPAALTHFAALQAIPGAAAERAAIVWRGVIELTNAGATDRARTLLAREHLTTPALDLPPSIQRDATIVLGQLALAPDGDPLEALHLAAALGATAEGKTDPAYTDLLQGAFVRLVNRSRYAEALDWIAPVTATCASGNDAGATDARNALAIVIENAADPASVSALLRPIMLDPARRDGILLDAFCRLVDAGRYDDAIAMADDDHIVSRAVARDDAAGRDARLALALLDLATGDPMDVPSRLAGLAIDLQRRREILISAFSRLVNTARYQDAQSFATTEAIADLAEPHDKIGTDAVIGLAILDLVTGDPAHAPTRIATIPIDEERRRQITLGAFVTLVNRARYDDATALRATTPIDAWANTHADADATDATRAIAVLELMRGDPAALPALIKSLDIAPADIPPLAINGFSKLVNAGRYTEAVDLAAALHLDPADPTLTDLQKSDLWLGRTVIELAIGDAALVEAHLRQCNLPAADQAVLLLSAYVRLVNEANYAAATTIAAHHSLPALIAQVEGALAIDTMVASAVVELAIGDPATVPALIADFQIPQAKRDELIATAFIRLINAARYDAAAALAAAHNIATLTITDDVGADLALCRARLDLVHGDPNNAPARLIGHQIPPIRQAEIILGTLIRLVNQANYPAARTLTATHAIDDEIAIATPNDHNDAIQALITLELNDGDPAQVATILARFPALPGTVQDTALAEAFIRLMNASRIGDAETIMATGHWLDRIDSLQDPLGTDCYRALIHNDLRNAATIDRIPARVDALVARGGSPADVESLIEAGFVAAMSRNDQTLAIRLYPRLTRQPGPFTTVNTEADRSFFYAYGVFLLGITPPQPHRAEIAFSAVRRGTIGTLTPGERADGLFWESVRGEMIALHATDRAAEADALGQLMQSRYQGSPADLLAVQSAAIQDKN